MAKAKPVMIKEDAQDAFSIIMEEIEKIEGPKSHKGASIEIVCPFHDDSKPSCGINISYEKKVDVGVFNCWACEASGSWNKLAAKLGLRQLKKWQQFKGSSQGELAKVRKAKKDFENTNNYTKKRLFEEVGGAVLPWPKKKEWRGYPGAMIERVEGYMFDDRKRDELMLVLPIYINSRYRGGVKALWDKPEKGPSYINTSGDWVMDYGLLGYDFIRKHDLFGCRAVVVVEGPRDWLRMVLNKIPAVGILGARMFTEKKLMLLMSLGIEKIYVLADNDKAGRGMVKIVEGICQNKIECEELKLPRKKDENGKLIKLDPDDAPQKIIDKVKTIVYETKPMSELRIMPRKKKPH